MKESFAQVRENKRRQISFCLLECGGSSLSTCVTSQVMCHRCVTTATDLRKNK